MRQGDCSAQKSRSCFSRQQPPSGDGWVSEGPSSLPLPLQVSASSDPRAAGDEELPPSGRARGLRRSGQAGPRRHRRRGATQQTMRSPVQPQPSGAGQEESLPFVLDLQSLPGLANVDLSAQNPNIQVRSGAGWDAG